MFPNNFRILLLLIFQNFFKKKALIFFGIGIIFFNSGLFAQWVNNPSINTEVVHDLSKPVNISAITDSEGGAFLIWQDHKGNGKNIVYFMHINDKGKTSFDGNEKKVCNLKGKEVNPVAALSQPDKAVILWKDFSKSKSGELVVQKVNNNGTLLWSNEGIQITKTNNLFSNYDVSYGSNGNTFISYVAKKPNITGNYLVKVQKLNTNGNLLFNADSSTVYSSKYPVNKTAVITDNKGGAYVLWLEIQGKSTSIFVQHINNKGHILWGKYPLSVSDNHQNIITYTAEGTGAGYIYVSWQTQLDTKHIYHQLINANGKTMWTKGGKIVTRRKGNQFNPQAVFEDSTIILSWTNGLNDNKKVFIQKYNFNGNPMWKAGGISVAEINGSQFGQKIVNDANISRTSIMINIIDVRLN